MIIYLHGFNSAPSSFKARRLAGHLAALGRASELVVPALPEHPDEAIAVAEALLAGHDPARVTLVGSSLGGHYATWLAERHGVRAVLVNPAIRPFELLAAHVGPQRNLYTGACWQLTAAHLDALRRLEVPAITRPGRYLLVVATADEVLDWRAAVARYRGVPTLVHGGGDHGFADCTRYFDTLIAFADAR